MLGDEVEQVLLSHPAVAAVAVFPVRSELAEDEVMVAIVPDAGARIDPVELVRFCETRLPHFAVPRYVDLLEDLPRTENGKVRKVVLRERGGIPIGVGRGTTVKGAILDKNVRIGENVTITNRDRIEEADRPELNFYIRNGIVVVVKNGTIADGSVI